MAQLVEALHAELAAAASRAASPEPFGAAAGASPGSTAPATALPEAVDARE